ncbi:MAG: AI-2E family transporter [Alphaproteobacteria bacterium]|nr:AI-2E family transporter [Alphaproteobacteria bacterium]
MTFVAALAIGAALVFQLRGLLLLVFGGILLAVALDGMAEALARRSGIARRWALAVVVVLLLTLLGASSALIGAQVASQISGLADQVTRAVEGFSESLRGTGIGRVILRQLEEARPENMLNSGIFGQMTGVASSTLGVLMDVLILVVIGLYFAATPARQAEGAVRLVPPTHRARARELLGVTGRSLRRYLLGKLAAMTLVAVLVGTGLALIGVPFPIALGILAGLLDFVPIFGPIVAAVPALLLAIGQGGRQTLLVAALFLAVQQLEGYFVLPLIEKRAVHVPPVLTVISVVGMGVLLGLPGTILAEPLTVVMVVWVRKIWIEWTLGETG